MTVDERSGYLKHHWPAIKAPRLAGTYQPQPALRIEIPQPHGRLRQRGLPPVTDRVIQPAIAQVLRWMWEPPFHPNRYGLRRMRSAQQALHRAQSEVIKGRKWVVALDFDSVFDRVKQDRLMPKLKAEIQDKARLGLLNGYLKSGVEINGRYEKTAEGVPQGSPRSPLLSNRVLNELDQERERRGHPFVR
ncbi:MAG: hypothetical protein GKR94_04580 [Gammaproteobacteria bacterium]|nr:hypothetical protein [Gammaproteobacteria bacterium]